MTRIPLAAATAALLTIGIGIPAASAAPLQPSNVTLEPGIVEPVRRDCAWVDNKWTYRRGDKRLVCRPDRPRGRNWVWFREGPRVGWYNPSRREWHYRGW